MGGEIFLTCPDRPWGPPSLLYIGYRVFHGGKERPGRDADPSPPSSTLVMKGWSYTSTPCMGRTACTEFQCLYKGALYFLLPLEKSRLFQHYFTWLTNLHMKQQCDMFPLLPFVMYEPHWLYRQDLDAKAVFLGSFAKLLKATISCVVSVRPLVHMEQLGIHWTDFY